MLIRATGTSITALGQSAYQAICATLEAQSNRNRLEDIMTLELCIGETFYGLQCTWFKDIWLKDGLGQIASSQLDATFNNPLAHNRPRIYAALRTAYHPKHDLPPPDPRHLRVHTTACRIAHPPGAARSLDLVGLAAVDGLRCGPSVAACRGSAPGCSSALCAA